MFLERPLSLKQIFHYYTQINQQRDRIIRMQQLTYNFFSFFSLFCCWFVLVFFFFVLLLSIPAFFFVLFFFCSFRVGRFLFLPFFFLASLFLFFLFTSFHSSIFPCPSRWCRVVMLKTAVYGNQVRFESLKNSAGTCTKSDKCYIVIYSITTTQQ